MLDIKILNKDTFQVETRQQTKVNVIASGRSICQYVNYFLQHLDLNKMMRSLQSRDDSFTDMTYLL